VQRLLENLYRPHYLKGQETQRDLMRLAGQIAEKATLAYVTRRRNASALDDLVEFLELTWSKHFALMAAKENF
jgi:predicted transcriptional regulator of viral defense system